MNTVTGPGVQECLATVEDEESFVDFIVRQNPQLDSQLVRRITRIVALTFEFKYSFEELKQRQLNTPITIIKAKGDDYSFIENSDAFSSVEPTVIELEANHYGVLKDPDIDELVGAIGSAKNRQPPVIPSPIPSPAQMPPRRLTPQILRSLSLFKYLSSSELSEVQNICRVRNFHDGEIIIAQGDKGDSLFVVLEGEVGVWKSGVQLATLAAGHHFGEMSLIDNRPRSATIRTLQDSVLILISRSDFSDILRKDHVLANKILWNFIQTLSTRLRAVQPHDIADETTPLLTFEV
jgi:hypothetical protein